MKYNVYFELYGKKMQTEIEAVNAETAKYLIRGKIKFHKIEQIPDIPNFFNDIFPGFR